ncbi:Holliday junction resolvase RecU [Caryophanon tenue]|uniref:Holliday junction resolvase RecU n=1 Tax=Caryophanon tenue TaxID=33978 RepID=A0A1C0Y5C0_9BACL|nr:Holliday junction resolvase RecU [Caryophanon tenue]OCS82333.1 Holliday junction resolvase RecU [Caryophanon tenue]
MVIRYPNGKAYTQKQPTSPTTAKKAVEKKQSFSNRGKTLEDEINEANEFYLRQKLAVIHKKPVPLQIVKVEYPSRSAAVVREAYFRTPSTTDYNGIWQARYIDFEAKETENKTSFPLKNIHAHQVQHMQAIVEQGGITFVIVRFSKLERYFLLSFDVLKEAWDAMLVGARKSIPLAIFETSCLEIQTGYYPRLDYLKAVEQFYEQT